MQRATNPCRQINSETIKGASLCYLSPVIHGKCSIIGARCIPNVEQFGLEKAWKDVCHRRDNCDKTVSAKNCFAVIVNSYQHLFQPQEKYISIFRFNVLF